MSKQRPHRQSEFAQEAFETRSLRKSRYGTSSGIVGSIEQDEAIVMEPSSDGGFAIADLLPRLLCAKWLIIGVFTLVSVIAIPSIWLTQVPMFEATALVRVAPVVSRIVFKTEENAIPFYMSYLNTEISIAYSETVLKRVLDREDVRQTSWHAKRFPAVSGLLGALGHQALADALVVKQRPKTELIEISMVGPDPRDAAAIANAVMEEYMYVSQETLEQIDARLHRTLREERRVLDNKKNKLYLAKHELLERLGRVDSEDVRASLYAELLKLESEREALRRESVLDDLDLQAMREASKVTGRTERRCTEDPEWRRINIDVAAWVRPVDLDA